MKKSSSSDRQSSTQSPPFYDLGSNSHADSRPDWRYAKNGRLSRTLGFLSTSFECRNDILPPRRCRGRFHLLTQSRRRPHSDRRSRGYRGCSMGHRSMRNRRDPSPRHEGRRRRTSRRWRSYQSHQGTALMSYHVTHPSDNPLSHPCLGYRIVGVRTPRKGKDSLE